MHSTHTASRAALRAILVGALVLGAASARSATPNHLPFQGRVAVEGIPFTGTGQFRFALIDASDTVQWANAPDLLPADGAPDDPVALPVAKGLYQVQLGVDTVALPADLFARGLEIRLRVWFDDGTHGIQRLQPDQPVAAVPYARHSSTADQASTARTITGGIPSTQLTGTLTTAQLPPTVAYLDAGPTFAGTVRAPAFQGAGAVPWTATAMENTFARPNTGILAINEDAPVQFTLPENAEVGDVVRALGAAGQGWIAMPPPGARIVGAQPGTVWTPTEGERLWRGVAMSANGQLVAAVASNAPIVISRDHGQHWELRENRRAWTAITVSPDGTRLAAAAMDGQIHVSADSGRTWTTRGETRRWQCLASSADGSLLFAGENFGNLWYSRDGGNSWVSTDNPGNWTSVACSEDGQRVVAADQLRLVVSGNALFGWRPIMMKDVIGWSAAAVSGNGGIIVAAPREGHLLLSTDGGGFWRELNPSASWRSVAISADGNKILAGAALGPLWYSPDRGNTWVNSPFDFPPDSVALTAEGEVLAAAAADSQIQLSVGCLRGGLGSLADFQYLGNDRWFAFSFQSANSDASGRQTAPASALATSSKDARIAELEGRLGRLEKLLNPTPATR